MWTIEVKHDSLGKYRLITGTDKNVVERKALAQRIAWDTMWEKRLEQNRKAQEREEKIFTKQSKIEKARELTEEAVEAIEGIRNILKVALEAPATVIWESLKDKSQFTEPEPAVPCRPNEPHMPKIANSKYNPQLSLLDRIISSRRQRKTDESKQLFEADYKEWQKKHAEVLLGIERAAEQFEADVASWGKKKEEFERKREENNEAIAKRKEDYHRNMPEAIVDCVEIALSKSEYPDTFPDEFDVEYNPANKILIIDRSLPTIDILPNIKEVKYIQSKDEFTESKYPEHFINGLYDDLIYQIILRSIYEVFSADTAETVEAIILNGWVETVDRATGKDFRACILSVQVGRKEFMSLNLKNVDPKVCFKGLRGIGSSKLHSLTPIAPIMSINREDKRFIASHDVSGTLDETINLAVMDWEEFEHLIRELFGKEFSASGGEVKITRASRDSGVDAVAFDPDPIRGGKIVIQAKRYTNTVGVSAVRDLYGTVLNEGATKGILVTTTDYGPDSYDFAKGKPLTLLSGNNLLHLLEKHGHKAMIDIRAAKKIAQGKSY